MRVSTDAVHTDGSLDGLQRGVVAYSAGSFARMNAWSRLDFHDESDVAWTSCDVPLGDLNCLVYSYLQPSVADRKLDRIVADAERLRRCVRAYVLPIFTPGDLAERLVSRGFVEQESPTAMIYEHRGERFEFGSHTVHEVRDRQDMERWSLAMVRGFGAPESLAATWASMHAEIGFGPETDWRHFMVLDDGGSEPVATVSTNVAGGMGGLSAISVLPSHRGLGLSILATRVGLHAVQQAGIRYTNLMAVPGVAGLYERVGFRNLCPCRILEREPPADRE